MDDQGFDFAPTERRAPKPFEPPPWERDAFEELKRKQAEEGPPAAAEEREEDQAPSTVPTAPASAEQSGREPEQVKETAPGSQEPDDGAEVDEAQVIEMLAGLAEEDPARPQGYFTVAFGAGLLMVAIGGVLVIWAMAALVSSRQTGWVGQWSGAGLGLFGAFFLGMGVWMLYRTLKQRGVL
jgi:hypothetical protein